MWHRVQIAALVIPVVSAAAQLPRVIAVYPSGPEISNHTLRISIRFAAPVQREVLPHLHLLNEAGAGIQHAFLEQELWSPDRRELTVLFDPARLKVGVVKHDNLGLPLDGTSSVQLVLDAVAIKQWRVSSLPCLAISSREWQQVIPTRGTREALRISFPEPVDHVTGQLIAVIDSSRRRVSGSSSLLDHEKLWAFTPSYSWAAGQFRVLLTSNVETPCGDRLEAPFEGAINENGDPRGLPVEALAFQSRIRGKGNR